MKRQAVRPEVLQGFLLIQDGTIRAHEHVIVRVKFFKRSVVLILECALEDIPVDPQHLIRLDRFRRTVLLFGGNGSFRF